MFLRTVVVSVLLVAPLGCGKPQPPAPEPDPEKAAEVNKPAAPEPEPKKEAPVHKPGRAQLGDEQVGVRLEALTNLVQAQDAGAVEDIRALIAAKRSPLVTYAAHAALGRLDPDRAAEHLKAAVTAWDWIPTGGPLNAQLRPDDVAAATRLVRSVAAGAIGSSDPKVFTEAYRLLELTGPGHDAVVRDAVRGPALDPKHPGHARARRYAETAGLEAIWIDELGRATDPEVRHRAAANLCDAFPRKVPAARPDREPPISDERFPVDWYAKFPADRIPAARALLKDNDPVVRTAVAHALLFGGRPNDALPVLLRYPWARYPGYDGSFLDSSGWHHRDDRAAYMPARVGHWLRTKPNYAERQKLGELAAELVRTGDPAQKRVGLSALKELDLTDIALYLPGLKDKDAETRAVGWRMAFARCDDLNGAKELLHVAVAEKDVLKVVYALSAFPSEHALDDRATFDLMLTLGREERYLGATRALPTRGPLAPLTAARLVTALKKGWDWGDKGGNQPVVICFRLLVQIGAAADKTVPDLIELLESGDAYMVAGVAQTLVAIGPAAKPAVPKLVLAVRRLMNEYSKNFFPLTECLLALGQFDELAKDALPEFATFLKGYEWDLNVQAARWRVDPTIDPEFPERMLKWHRDPKSYRPNPNVARSFSPLEALERLGPKCKPYLPALEAIVRASKGPNDYPWVMERLAPERTAEWVELICAPLRAQTNRPRTRWAFERPSPLLGSVRDRNALMALRAIARPEPAARRAGCELLGLLDPKWTTAALPRLDALRRTDPDPAVRAEADAAFKRIDLGPQE